MIRIQLEADSVDDVLKLWDEAAFFLANFYGNRAARSTNEKAQEEQVQ